jgi:endonuclease-3 related protein
MSSDAHRIFRRLFEEFGPQHWWPAKTPFEVIVGAILTQNTAWKNVERAVHNLRRRRLLNAGAMLRAKTSDLAQAIRPAGYFNVKTKRLKSFLEFLGKRRLGQFLKTSLREAREELLSIKGVGPETADSILLYAAQKPIFVVDAYTRRTFSRLGLVPSNAGYEEIQRFFMRNLPRSTRLFNEYHALIVAHAKAFCRKKPLCEPCPLQRLCRYGQNLS